VNILLFNIKIKRTEAISMKKGRKAIFGIVVTVAVVLVMMPVAVTVSNNEEYRSNHSKEILTSLRGWHDDFDSYEIGQFLDGTPDDGGWKGWDDTWAFGAYVTDEQSYSSPHSVDVEGPTDLVHEFLGYTSGQWTFTAWQYVPDGFYGESSFILLSHYEDGLGQDNKWSVQLRFDSSLDIVEAEDDGEQLPLIADRWVQLRIEIDLDNDWFECFYDNTLLQAKEWTAGVFNEHDGILNIGAVDLFANGATSVYYDDFSLVEKKESVADLQCAGNLNWVEVEPGSTVTGEFTVQNVGSPSSSLNWGIATYPDWGQWTFTPSSGESLAPEDGEMTVGVSVFAPNQENMDFTGEVKVVNKDNKSDFDIISVSLTTPVDQQLYNPLINRILEYVQNAFPLLRHLLKV
jgi:hypothetical protein